MKASYYFYKGKIKSLPKGVFFLVIFFLLLLIPLIASLFIVLGTASLIINKVFRSLIPGKSKKNEITYANYEIIEDVKEKKHLQ